MSADPFTDEAIADIRRQIAEALRNGTWGPGVSSHQTVAAPTPDYPRGYPVAEFKHASDAMLCDSLLHLMPAALDAIERLRAEVERLVSLVRQAKGEAIRDTEKSDALLRADLAAFELIGRIATNDLTHSGIVTFGSAAVATERSDKLRDELEGGA